jgi:hypothetical protein
MVTETFESVHKPVDCGANRVPLGLLPARKPMAVGCTSVADDVLGPAIEETENAGYPWESRTNFWIAGAVSSTGVRAVEGITGGRTINEPVGFGLADRRPEFDRVFGLGCFPWSESTLPVRLNTTRAGS